MDASPVIGTVGAYRLVERVGGGPRNEVYLAETSPERRPAIIEIARGLAGDAQAYERYQREAELAHRISHPNVVEVLEAGEDPGVGAFLALEYVDGRPLPERLRSGDLDVEDRFRILIQALNALEAAHQRGVLHGSLRPERILCCPDGAVKVSGFGRPLELEERNAWAYAAPERIRGEAPSPKADEYALAVIAFEVLIEQLPFRKQDLFEDSVTAPPLAIPGSALLPRIREVFERALAPDPMRRFGSARAFLKALVRSGPLDELTRARLLEELSRTRLRLAADRYGRAVGFAIFGIAVAVASIVLGDRLRENVPTPRDLRAVEVVSAPQGATVLVDGQPVGRTPRRAWIPSDTRRIRLEKEGYRSVDHVLAPDQRGPFRFTLEPSPIVRALAARMQPKAPEPPPAPVQPSVTESSETRAGGLLPLLRRFWQGR